MAYDISNANFETMKSSFKKETGIEVTSETMSLYIAYFQAKTTDINMQLQSFILQELSNLNNKMIKRH